MALINCWECETQISDSAKHCPSCGAKQKKSPSITLKNLKISILAAFSVVTLLFLLAPQYKLFGISVNGLDLLFGFKIPRPYRYDIEGGFYLQHWFFFTTLAFMVFDSFKKLKNEDKLNIAAPILVATSAALSLFVDYGEISELAKLFNTMTALNQALLWFSLIGAVSTILCLRYISKNELSSARNPNDEHFTGQSESAKKKDDDSSNPWAN